MKSPRILPALVFLLSAPPLFAEAGAIALDANLQASIWNEQYKLGYGGSLGFSYGLSERGEIALRGHYGYYAPENDVVGDPVHEFGGLLFYFFRPSVSDFTPRVGVHAGYDQFGDDPYFEIGVDGHLLFHVADRTDFYTMLMPGYVIGEDPLFIFRIGLGLQYNLAP